MTIEPSTSVSSILNPKRKSNQTLNLGGHESNSPRRGKKPRLAPIAIGQGEDLYPEPPTESLTLSVSPTSYLVISHFNCLPGYLPEATFRSWRLVTNLATRPLSLTIAIPLRKKIHVSLQPDESLLLGPEVRSAWRWTTRAEYRLVELQHRDLMKLARETFGAEPKEGPALMKFSSIEGGIFNDTMECLREEKAGYTDVAQALGVAARIRLLRKALNPSDVLTLGTAKWSVLDSNRRPRTHRAVRTALDIIHSDPCREISVAELAKQVGLSRQHFQLIFKKDVGESPARYQRRIRLDRAIHLIREGEPIAQIANDCLFSDQSHLTRAIKSFTGKTPTQLI